MIRHAAVILVLLRGAVAETAGQSKPLRPFTFILDFLPYGGGRVLLRSGRMLTVDEDRLRTRAQAAADGLRARNGAGFALAASLAPYLADACRAAAAAPYPVNRLRRPRGVTPDRPAGA